MHDNDRFGELEELSSWQLVHDKQDIRGHNVVDPAGASYGKIEDMLVDKTHEHVAAVRLEDGRIVSVDDLEITDNAVIYHDGGAASRTDYAKVRRPA
ncbi:PRC-barrel domain-containing protein [uncultured Croceicoccus sp.]|uniref:PRC-barrel domain-containing protein n=1 Tax=uncultured Croceicoccus sp. TaxID=1295329 RepID=UPI002633A211|nr:PRC-barrel domain-containing protein [uncultured Croceicoccus sp.]